MGLLGTCCGSGVVDLEKGDTFAKAFIEYCYETDGIFKKFINDYQVARNAKKDSTRDLLECAWEWFQKGETKDVDGFARTIKKKELTHGLAISPSSKIMFLMNPWEVMPLDKRAKVTVGYKGNNYADYLVKVEYFRQEHEKEIHQALQDQ